MQNFDTFAFLFLIVIMIIIIAILQKDRDKLRKENHGLRFQADYLKASRVVLENVNFELDKKLKIMDCQNTILHNQITELKMPYSYAERKLEN